MTFPVYPEYKYSGNEWLGKIPSHWHVKPVKYHLREGYAGLKIGPFGSQLTSDMLDDGGEFKVYGQENVISGDFSRGNRYINSQKFHELLVYEICSGDILITMMGTSGRCDVVPECIKTGVMDSHLIRVRTNENLLPEFLQIIIDKAFYVACQVKADGKGSIMHGLNSSIVKNLIITSPDISEQKKILNFLNYETSKIDELIDEQQQLIELLNEKRQSVISNAVCRGLHPDVPMKDSGVKWLGFVPEHWSVKALKHIVSIPITDGPHETPEFIDEGVPFVSAEAVSSGVVDFAKIRGFISRESHEKYSLKYAPKRGDIFLVKSGATTGVCAIVETDDEFNIWSPLAVVRCMDEIEPQFVLNYMRSLNFQEAIALNWNFGTQQNIGMGVIENLMLPVPPHHEQIEILKMLRGFLNESNALISEASKGIALLTERRSALISAAVCGHIDVRAVE